MRSRGSPPEREAGGESLHGTCKMRVAILLATLALCVGQNFRRPTLQSLFWSLDTWQPRWLLLQSYRPMIHHRKVSCIKYVRTNLTKKEYYFKKYYQQGNHEKVEKFFGVLAGETKLEWAPTLTTYKLPRRGKGQRNMLLYWCALQLCSVFQVKHNGKNHCQIHVWNKRIKDKPTACLKAYKHYCPKAQHMVYHDWCQHKTKKQ